MVTVCSSLIGLSSKQKTQNIFNILCKSRSFYKEEGLTALEALCIIKAVYSNSSEYASKEGWIVKLFFAGWHSFISLFILVHTIETLDNTSLSNIFS